MSINLEKTYVCGPDSVPWFSHDFMNRTDKKFFATGDSGQIQPFGFHLNNVVNAKKYLNRCINIMFPNQIILQYNKRLTNKKHQLLLKQIKENIFNLKIDVGTTMKKYFKTINKYSDLKTYENNSFFNFRAEKINKIIQSKWYYQRIINKSNCIKGNIGKNN